MVLSFGASFYNIPIIQKLIFLSNAILDSCVLVGDLAALCAFAAALAHLRKRGALAGLSLQTLLCTVNVRILHLGTHYLGTHWPTRILHQGFFVVSDLIVVAAGCSALALAVTHGRFGAGEADGFGSDWIRKLSGGQIRGVAGFGVHWACLYAIGLVVCILWVAVRGGKDGQEPALHYYCAFEEALGAIAVLPQLVFIRKHNEVSRPLAYYVACVAGERMAFLLFHLFRGYATPWLAHNRITQMVAEGVNLCILLDFLLCFLKSERRGDNLLLPFSV
jgi:hypothetical protein